MCVLSLYDTSDATYIIPYNNVCLYDMYDAWQVNRTIYLPLLKRPLNQQLPATETKKTYLVKLVIMRSTTGIRYQPECLTMVDWMCSGYCNSIVSI